MSTAGKAWIVATAIAAVEALKDQGVCRWNYPMRLIHQQAKNRLRSFTQANLLSSSASASSPSASAPAAAEVLRVRRSRAEANMERVMGLSCWGPTTVRF